MNELLVGLAAQYVITSMAHGELTPVLVTTSFDTFVTRATTEQFFAMYAEIDPRVSSRLIVVLSALPPGLPKSRLQDIINRLRPICRGVGYHVEGIPELSQIDLSNSYNPIVVLPAAACLGSTSLDLKQLFAALQSRRAQVLVAGVGSDKDASALRSLGADMISMKRP